LIGNTVVFAVSVSSYTRIWTSTVINVKKNLSV